MNTTETLRETRGTALAECQRLLDGARAEDRDLTDTERAAFDDAPRTRRPGHRAARGSRRAGDACRRTRTARSGTRDLDENDASSERRQGAVDPRLPRRRRDP